MISWQTARYRWRTLLGSLIALTLGIGLLATTAIVIASAQAQPDPRYADADLLVASEVIGETPSLVDVRRPLDGSVADDRARRIAGLDGVDTAIADRSVPVELSADGETLTESDAEDPLGHGWSSHSLGGDGLTSGEAPRTPNEVVAPDDLGLDVGDAVVMRTPGHERDATVVGTTDGTSVYLSDEVAARESSGSTTIGVALTTGADAATIERDVRAIVGDDASILTGSERTKLENAADRSDRFVGAQLLGAMGVLASFVSVFVVATTFAFVVAQRRREIGLLRAIGATPRQVRRMLLGEAVLVGVVASVLGAALGLLGAPILGHWMVEADMQARGWEPDTVMLPLIGSVIVGIVVAIIGVWAASRRAAKVRPLQALRESSVDHRPMTKGRWGFGVSAVGLGFALAAATPVVESGAAAGTAVGAVAALVTGLALLAPVYLPLLVRRVSLRTTVSGELVRAEAAVGVRRIASLMAPILVTVAFCVTVTGMTETMKGAFDNDERADVPTSDVVVAGDESPGVFDAAIDRLVQAGPRRLDADLPTGVVVGDKWTDAVGVADERIAGLAVSNGFAADHDLAAGDRIDVTWADGTSGNPEVTDIRDDLPAGITMSRTTARRHDPAALSPEAYVDGLETTTLKSALDGDSAEPVSVESYVSAGNAEEEGLLRLFVFILLGLSAGFTCLAIANTLVMGTAERRRDFAVLRLAGASVRQVARVVASEALIVVAIAAVLGIAVAWPALYGIAAGLGDDLDADVAVRMAWPTVAGVTGLCALIAVGASVLTTLSATRGTAVDTTRDR